MKSIKRGRGPSFMSGIMCILVGIFGVIWTIGAASIGGGLFALFGIVFIAVAVVNGIYNFKNAKSKNRYSEYDIVEGNEETDPFNERFGTATEEKGKSSESKFCPYCGTGVKPEFEYCNNCGKKLP